MISLLTNVPQYINDISEEIRLFLGITEIVFHEALDAEMVCKIRLEEKQAVCELVPQQIKTSVPFTPSTETLEKKRREKKAIKLATYSAMSQAFSANTPWGSLTGIRPTKLYRDLISKKSISEADKQFTSIYSVSAEKLHLLKHIHTVQAPIIATSNPMDFDIYLGIPYCRTRCVYCSFGTELYKTDAQLREYLDHLKEEISGSSDITKECNFNLRCSYFGGGTPTVLSSDMLDELLDFTEDQYNGLGNEFTVEAGRPDTITKDKLSVLRKHNVSRISINPQTMNDNTLKAIGRSHTSKDIEVCFNLARDLGFENINMDVIAGLPGEHHDDFIRTLDQITNMHPDSLTVHTLAIKKSSLLISKLEQYPLPLPSETEKMVSSGAEYASNLGMTPYYMYRQKYMSGNLENVGYCTPGKECMYNIDMMEEIVSVMAHGAHTITKRVFPRANRVERIANPKDISTYYFKLPVLLDSKREAFALTIM